MGLMTRLIARKVHHLKAGFLVILLLEGTFRAVGMPYKVKYIPNENSLARFDPEQGWSYIPDNSSMHMSGDIVKQVHFDSNGARVQDPDVELNYTKPSILSSSVMWY